MLFYWAPDDRTPRGGIKQIYRHVEILQRAGLDARVLHTQHGFVCDWFEHEARLAYLGESVPRKTARRAGSFVTGISPPPDLRLRSGRRVKVEDRSGEVTNYELGPGDVIVVPEYLGAALADAPIDLPLVVFNQNVHGTFRGLGWQYQRGRTVYTKSNVLGAMVVSEHNRRYLDYAFPSLDVHRVVNGIDAAMFHPRDAKRKHIAFMPRKQASHLEQIINILGERGALRGWTLVPIGNMSETEVAKRLREAFVFLSTCHEEGFGLPAAEAGMSGCLVVGYTGGAAEEYFVEGLAERVDQDDVLGFVISAEKILGMVERNERAALDRGRAFSTFLTERYSFAREAESVLSAWNALLGKV